MNKLTPFLIRKIENIVGKKYISTSAKDLVAHSKDWSFHPAKNPEVVIWPKKTEEVSAVMKIANKNSIFVTPWGGGSSTEGNPIPVKGGIVLDMTRMNKIIKIYKEDFQVVVQPGIVGDILNQKLKKYKLFFPPAPGSSNIATVGGMIANNAGGMHAVAYGVVGDWVLKLKIVMADGQIIETGSRSFKSVTGYDLKKLFIGSEGTLGIITEAVLKLLSVPDKKVAKLISFKNIKLCTSAALNILKSDLEPAAMEFMDSVYISYIGKAKGFTIPANPSLIVQFHGNEKTVLEKMNFLKKQMQVFNPTFEKDYIAEESLKKLWKYRKAGRTVLQEIYPTKAILAAEVGLPISKLFNFLKKTDSLSKKYKIPTIIFGHLGDGNFHDWALYEKDNKKSFDKAISLNEELIKYAIKISGTTSGEHGIGIGKRKYLPIEYPTSLSLMKKIKKLFDPKEILNPGKIFLD